MSTSDGDTQPLSFQDLSPSDWKPEDTPAPPSGDTSTTSPTTSPPPGSATTPGVSQPGSGEGAASGPIPFERHKAILDGREAEWNAKWGRVSWADEFVNAGATPDELRQAREFFRGVHGNPQQFVRDLLERAKTTPQLAEMVRSIVGAPASTGPSADEMPQADYYQEDAQGRRTPFYSGPQQQKLLEWQRAQIAKDYTPLLEKDREATAARQQADEEKALTARATERIQSDHAELKRDPEFQKVEPEFAVFLRGRLEARAKGQGKPMGSLREEFSDFLLPRLATIGQTAEASAVAKFRTQAASSGIAPNAAATSTPADYKSFRDIPRDQW